MPFFFFLCPLFLPGKVEAVHVDMYITIDESFDLFFRSLSLSLVGRQREFYVCMGMVMMVWIYNTASVESRFISDYKESQKKKPSINQKSSRWDLIPEEFEIFYAR